MSDAGETFGHPLSRWFLLDGDRRVVAALLVGAVFVGAAALALTGTVDVGEGSYVPTLFGSGIVSGLATVLTVTLSINQLILSRVFGTPNELSDRLDATLSFRRDAEDVLGAATVPNDPRAFLVDVAEALKERASTLEDERTDVGERDDESEAELRSYAERLQEYADGLVDVDEESTTMGVLSRTLSSEYAELTTTTRRHRSEYDDLGDDARGALDDVFELLRIIAIVRQFFKTVAMQQDLALLSKRLIYAGVPALLAAGVSVLLYTNEPTVTIPPTTLPWVVSVAFALVFAPVAILVAHILRVATITRVTVSVGPFVPPEEQSDDA